MRRPPYPTRAAGAWGLLLLLLTATSCASPDPVAATASAVRVIVSRDGLYTLTSDDLTQAGFDPGVSGLALSLDGQPIPYEQVGAGRDWTIRFYGRSQRRPGLSDRNVYWLERADADAPSAARDASPPGGVTPANAGLATARVEEQRRYLPYAEPGGDRWFWTSLFAPAEFEVTLDTPAALPEGAALRVRLWAESSAPAEPDHHLQIRLNDAPVADVVWDDRGPHLVEAALPAGLLRDGENRIELALVGDTGAPVDSVLLDWIEVDYARTLALDDGQMAFGGNAPAYRVELPSGRAREADLAVWDVTDAAQPVPLAGHEVRDGALVFGSDGAERRFLVASGKDLLSPEAVEPVTSSTLPDWPGGADVVVVTAPQFRDTLQPLVTARQEAGLRVAVLDVQVVYDAFSHGRPDPAAIRDLIQHARSGWAAPAPRYLLLVGDASYDPVGYLGGSEVDIIPTQFVDTTFTGWTASDVWYALPPEAFEPDGVTPRADGAVPLIPVMAVGRLPAQDAEQAAAMVAKVLAYEAGDASASWRRRAVLPADNDDPNFTREAEAFASALQGYTSEVVPVTGDGSAARAAVLDAFESGAGLIGYTGHGSVTLWAQEGILTVEDAAKLDNGDRLPLVFTVTCLSGFFEHPATVSLGEALVRQPGGGAVSALVPSGAALLEDQRPLSRALAEALAAPEGGRAAIRLGDAVLEAQSALPQGADGVQQVLLTFNLLGDPTLPLRQ